MRHSHGFNTVGDKLTAGKRIFHADMSHGDSVADADSRNEDRCAACHADACFDGLGNFIQVKMSRHDFAVCRNNADERSVKFFFCIAHCVKQAAVRGAFCAFFYVITSHECHPFGKSEWFFIYCSTRI